MKLYISLNQDEIRQKITYTVVCEIMCGAKWNTGKLKRLMKQYFTESEIESTYRLHKQAREWYLYKGVPKEIKMTLQTYDLWQKLADFCCQL